MDKVDVLELQAAGVSWDLQYWNELLERMRPRRVIELGCGTGRVTIPLAQTGLSIRDDFQLIGLDIEDSYLVRAKERIGQVGGNIVHAITLIHGDMRSFDFDEPADLIIIPYNSFALLLSTTDQLSCLESVRQSLTTSGVFAWDLFSPTSLYEFLPLAMKANPVIRHMWESAQPMEGIEWFAEECFDRYDPLSQIVYRTIASHAHLTTGSDKFFRQLVALRLTFPQELELLLRVAGLVPFERYGTYRREEFEIFSPQYLWLMRAVTQEDHCS